MFFDEFIRFDKSVWPWLKKRRVLGGIYLEEDPMRASLAGQEDLTKYVCTQAIFLYILNAKIKSNFKKNKGKLLILENKK